MFSPNTRWARISSISAAGRTCPPPRRSRRSSCSPSPARTGKATSTTSSCSASTAPLFSRRKSWTSIWPSWRKPRRRDHRKLGKELDLFSIQELAGPGLIFFHPKGGTVRKIIEDWMRDQYLDARLLAGLYAARGARRSVEDLRPLRFLRREHVQADGAGRCRIPAQAHELPVPHPDLRGQAAQLSRSAGPAGRAGHRLSLRAVRA